MTTTSYSVSDIPVAERLRLDLLDSLSHIYSRIPQHRASTC